jgi:hypothetical protein
MLSIGMEEVEQELQLKTFCAGVEGRVFQGSRTPYLFEFALVMSDHSLESHLDSVKVIDTGSLFDFQARQFYSFLETVVVVSSQEKLVACLEQAVSAERLAVALM